MKTGRREWLLGIIGALCFGIGDGLLGYVDPTRVNDAFLVIKAGHGLTYDLNKIVWTLLLGAIGVPFLAAGCLKMADLINDEKRKRKFRFMMLLLPVGWLIIHYTVTSSIYVYSWGTKNVSVQTAEKMAADFLSIVKPMQIVSYFFAGVPLVMLVIYVLQGKTVLNKRSQIFTPALWMAIFSCFKYVFPMTPFINLIDTFCMNAGMIIWFVYLVLIKV